MKKAIVTLSIYGTPFLVGAAVFAGFICVEFHHPTATTFYQSNMRGSLFAGFLTLGSFLLSLKTGIVIKIKESLYDQVDYQTQVATMQIGGGTDTIYGPLRRLSKVLSAAVLFALLASIAQLTVGLIDSKWAAATCLSLAGTAITFLLFAFALIQMNLHTWFGHWEEKGKKAIEKMSLEAASKTNEKSAFD